MQIYNIYMYLNVLLYKIIKYRTKVGIKMTFSRVTF